MFRTNRHGLLHVAVTVAGLILALTPVLSQAHCDTMDGPVVMDARTALEMQDIAPVLKWLMPERESEVRDAFQQTLSVRKLGVEARELADRWFFETVVRVHRSGEGAPYTGLKPAGSVADPSIIMADKALEQGSAESLAEKIGSAAARGIRERFERANEAKKYAGHSVEEGRKFVSAYVQYIHYVENLHSRIKASGEQGNSDTSPSAHQH